MQNISQNEIKNLNLDTFLISDSFHLLQTWMDSDADTMFWHLNSCSITRINFFVKLSYCIYTQFCVHKSYTCWEMTRGYSCLVWAAWRPGLYNRTSNVFVNKSVWFHLMKTHIIINIFPLNFSSS